MISGREVIPVYGDWSIRIYNCVQSKENHEIDIKYVEISEYVILANRT